MGDSRQDICQSTRRKLSESAGKIPSLRATVGLDGFVDEIIAVVDKRHDRDRYEPVTTIGAFGQKILRAVGQSSNYEMVTKQTKLGGNGPIMANALASAGMKIAYIGNLGYPNLHPIFSDFTKRAEVYSISEPGHTDALEFTDGKLMLGKHEGLRNITWQNIVARVGKEKLTELLTKAQLVALTNWTMIADMENIWKQAGQVLRSAGRNDRKLFVDLADPEKRMKEDIQSALKTLSELQQVADVILGLNLKESMEIAAALGLPPENNPDAAIQSTASAIRTKMGLYCVVIHPRRGAAGATAKHSAEFAGPFVQNPKISTGAGDHFNAGFCLGQVLGFSLEESLCTGVGTSGYYVRTANSPSTKDLSEFIGKLPPPEKA